jgi:transposase
MTRLYAYGLKNERIEECLPDFRFERTSIIGVIGLEGFLAPMIYKNTLDGDLFTAYVKECLIKELKSGDILIMDNLSSHKSKNEEAIKILCDNGIEVIWLPPYSSDLNPIELTWSKMKTYIRKKKPRTTEDLFSVLKESLDLITQSDIKNWFKHDGYFFEPINGNV